MPIPLKCECGKRYSVKDELAGRKVKCPSCEHVLVVPKSSSTGTDIDLGDLGGFDSPANEAASSRQVNFGAAQQPSRLTQNSKRRKTLRPRAKAAKGGNAWVVVAAAIGGAVVLIALLVFFFAMFTPSGDDPKRETVATLGSAEVEATSEPDEPPQVTQTGSTDSENGKPANGLPRLPGAVSTPPPHLLVDSPFDVEAYFKAPPANQNAAPLYLDALYEFSSDLEPCFSPAQQQRRGPVTRQRYERYSLLLDRFYEDEKNVSSTELDRTLKDYTVGFEKIDRAQRRDACVFESEIGPFGLHCHVQAVREVARVSQMKTKRDIEEGRFDGALKNIKRLLRLSRDLRHRGEGVSQLVSIAVNGICYEGCVKRVLASPNLTTKECDLLLAILVEHESQSINPFVESLRSQNVLLRCVLHDLKHRTGMFDPRHLEQQLGLPKDASIGNLLFWSAPSEFGKTEEVAASFSTYLKQMTDKDFAREVATANMLYQSLIAEMDRPYQAQTRNLSAVYARLGKSKTPFVNLFHGSSDRVLKSVVRGVAELHGTQCLVALRRWELQKQSSATPDLQAIVKAAGMSNVPQDPFGDGPLRMTQQNGKIVIYSVGSDGKDDNAQADWEEGKQPGDFIFSFEMSQ